MRGTMQDYLFAWGTHIFYALIIFFVGQYAVKIAVRFLRRLLNRTKMDEILVNFVGSFSHLILLIFVIIAALHALGVDTTSLIAVLGAAGLAVGLALKNSLQNFASGIMLILFRPFKVGDYVEVAGVSGAVEQVSIFSTVMSTPDNRKIVIPNGMLSNDKVINYSAKDKRRIDLALTVGYEENLRKVKEIIQSCLEGDERILRDPEPFVGVGAWLEHGVQLLVRPWVKKEDFWAVKTDLLEEIKQAFDGAGIVPPYPKTRIMMEEGRKKIKT